MVSEFEIAEKIRKEEKKIREEAVAKKAGLEEGMERREEVGKKEGLQEGKIAIAKEMKAKGFSIKDIIELTGLTKEVIEGL